MQESNSKQRIQSIEECVGLRLRRNTKWTLLYLCAGLNCDTPILEALFHCSFACWHVLGTKHRVSGGFATPSLAEHLKFYIREEITARLPFWEQRWPDGWKWLWTNGRDFIRLNFYATTADEFQVFVLWGRKRAVEFCWRQEVGQTEITIRYYSSAFELQRTCYYQSSSFLASFNQEIEKFCQDAS